MRRFFVPALCGLCLLLGPVVTTLVAETVDFRMTPLEQVKKIARQLRQTDDAGVTLTILHRRNDGPARDLQHLILEGETATPARVRARLAGDGFDSVSWSARGSRPAGACDSDEECKRKTNEMCKNADHKGVKGSSVSIVTHLDGSKTCSGDCEEDGAIAFVTCDPTVKR